MELREMTVKKEKRRREFKIEQSRRGTADWQIYTQVSRQLSLTSSFSCFWCVIRIIFGVFSWFVSVSFQNEWRRLPCCSDRPAEKEKQPQKFLLLPDPSGSMKFNYKHFFSPIKTALTGAHKCTFTSTDRPGFTHSNTCTHKTHLCLGNRTGAFVFLREEEANGHEELVDADSELLLILAPCGQWE